MSASGSQNNPNSPPPQGNPEERRLRSGFVRDSGAPQAGPSKNGKEAAAREKTPSRRSTPQREEDDTFTTLSSSFQTSSQRRRLDLGEGPSRVGSGSPVARSKQGSGKNRTSITPAVSKLMRTSSVSSGFASPDTKAERRGIWAYSEQEANVSNTEIRRSRKLPASIEARPERRQDYCLSCINAMSDSKQVKNKLNIDEYCDMEPNSNCSQTCGVKKETCTRLPQEFNRALNILNYCQYQADTGDEDETEQWVERTRKYAGKVHKAYKNLEAEAAREFGKEGKGSNAGVKEKNAMWADWTKARRKSAEQDQTRWEAGYGTMSSHASNVVCDREFEEWFLKEVLTTNAQKRVVYYGWGAK